MKTKMLLLPASAAALSLAFLAGLFSLGRLPSRWQRPFLPGRGLDWISRRDWESESRKIAARPANGNFRPGNSAVAAGSPAPGRLLSPAAAAARQGLIDRLKKQKILEMLRDYKPFLDKFPPDQAARLRQLLIDSEDALLQGITDRQAAGSSPADIAQFDTDSSRTLHDRVHEILGDEGYQAYKDFAAVLPYVKEGEQIGNRLYAENVPASADQIDSVVQAMLAAPKPPSMDRVADGTISVAAYDQALADSSRAFVASVASILNPDQVKILQSYEEETRAKYVRAASQVMRQSAP